ncbi:MAG: 2-oxoacid:acceptor oxidoreductase subunit alpha [bacterium]|nr:2-oxoacid:acceptor oxidoreductase subunit alpha [bacterium]
MSPKIKLLSGNESCVEGALAAGVNFYAGYPITPSTEIAELMAEKLPKIGGRFIQMEDEIAGMAAVIGGALTGAKAMTATSGPGFSLKQENLGYAMYTEIPCVLVDVQRGGPSTGLPTMPSQADIMQARWGTHGDHPVIALCPSSVSESFWLTVRAVNLSEKYRTPVLVMLDEVIGHMREKVEIPDSVGEIIYRKQPELGEVDYQPFKPDADLIPPMASFGDGFRFHVTGLAHDESGFPTSDPRVVGTLIERLHKKIDNNLDDIVQVDSELMEDAEIMVLAYGCTARSASRAVKQARSQGIKAGLFRPITIWPFPGKELKAYLPQLKHIVVPELNLGQLILEVERQVAGRVSVSGVNRADGELITPAQILSHLMEVK